MNKPTFEAGIAFTLAEMVRMRHIDAAEVRDVINVIRLDLIELKAAGAAQDDIEALEKAVQG